MGRDPAQLGGDQYGWAQLRANSPDEQKQIIAQMEANETAVPRDLWEQFNDTVMEEAAHQMNAVQDLEDRGLTVDIDLSYTHYTWPVMGEMTSAERSMDPRDRSELGDLEFGEDSIPIPITRKDYDIPVRKLEQLERGGQGVSTAHARMASRVVSQSLEDLIFNGWTGQSAEHQRHAEVSTLYGYRNHPDRLTFSKDKSLSDVDGWDVDPTEAPEDLNQMIGSMEDDHYDGQDKIIYMANDVWKSLRQDYATDADAGDKLLRDKLDQIPEIPNDNIRRSYFIPDGEAVILEPSPDVVELVRDPSEIQNIQWESHAGMQNKFAVMAIYAPAVKSTYSGKCGVMHATGLTSGT